VAGVTLSDLNPSHKAIKHPFFLNGSLKSATGLIQISESFVMAYSVEEPSYVHHSISSSLVIFLPAYTLVFPLKCFDEP